MTDLGYDVSLEKTFKMDCRSGIETLQIIRHLRYYSELLDITLNPNEKLVPIDHYFTYIHTCIIDQGQTLQSNRMK